MNITIKSAAVRVPVRVVSILLALTAGVITLVCIIAAIGATSGNSSAVLVGVLFGIVTVAAIAVAALIRKPQR